VRDLAGYTTARDLERRAIPRKNTCKAKYKEYFILASWRRTGREVEARAARLPEEVAERLSRK
jgi:hypothetical protein